MRRNGRRRGGDDEDRDRQHDPARALAARGPLEERVELSQSFYELLQKHPVPVYEPAIQQLQNNSAALRFAAKLRAGAQSR